MHAKLIEVSRELRGEKNGQKIAGLGKLASGKLDVNAWPQPRRSEPKLMTEGRRCANTSWEVWKVDISQASRMRGWTCTVERVSSVVLVL